MSGPGYAAMLRSLFAARRFGVRLGLDGMRAALAELGHPEGRLGHVLHVGGTNGKGSVAAMLEAMLDAAGVASALYTSPHLCRFTERFRVCGKELDPQFLEECFKLVAPRAEALPLTFFEQATLLAMVAFAAVRPAVSILEVGLGGRLDATNVVDPAVAAVTGVALDHEAVLGRDLPAIAAEKAGIFKPGRPAVIGACGAAEGRDELLTLARQRGCAPVVAAPSEPGDAGAVIGLGGPHQRANAAAALAILDALESVGGPAVPAWARREGLAAVRWPGRFERFPGEPELYLDVAHNPDGAAALVASLAELEDRPTVAVMGVSADKDAAAMLAALRPSISGLVATEGTARARPAAELAALWPGADAIPDPRAALDRARARAGSAGRVVVLGSVFVVGPVRAHLTGEATDPVVVQDPAATVSQPQG